MAEIAVWGVIAALGLATFATRLSFLALLGEGELPVWLRHLLHYVPPAILGALIAPEIFALNGSVSLAPDNPRLWAALAALLVARLSRSVLATIAAGMVALWVVQAGLG